jgi:F-type H+-transporting ATPase subunit b
VKRTLRLLPVFLFLAAAPALAEEGETPHPVEGEHGEGAGHEGAEGHHGLDPKTFAFQLVNFGVLVFILVKFGGSAMNKMLAARHAQLKKDIEEAAQGRLAAEARLAAQEKRMANLAQEVARLQASIKEEAEKEQARLLAVADEKSKRIQDDARFLMQQQVKEAERRFREELAGAAVRIAEEVVRRSVRVDDESRLAQSFVADIERAPAGRP